MKIRLLTSLVLAVVLAGYAPLFGAGEFVIDKNVHVGLGETIDNVVLLGGSARIEGRVLESVVALGGTVVVTGEVGDAVVGLGAQITLESSAVVEGDVVVLGGTLEKSPGCVIKGDTVYFDLSRILPGLAEGKLGLALIPLLIVLKLISIFIWFLLTLVVASAFPRQVTLASRQVRKSFWSVFAIGFLALIVFVGLVFIAALLSIILIGIPILLTLCALGFVIKVFGQVAVFHFFGDSMMRAFGKKEAAPLGAALLGLLIVSLLGFVPVLGLLFSMVVSMVGWGVAIRTKLGTVENWFQKKAG